MPIGFLVLLAGLIFEFVPHLFAAQYTVGLICLVLTLGPLVIFLAIAALGVIVALLDR